MPIYFYAARVLEKLGRHQEADRYYARLTAEFPASEYARKVRGPRGEKPASAAAAAKPSPKSKVQNPN